MARRPCQERPQSNLRLATLPANEFPSVDEGENSIEFRCSGRVSLKRLIEATSFAMAQQDVRYYLNGMLWEAQCQQACALWPQTAIEWRSAMRLCESRSGRRLLPRPYLPRKGALWSWRACLAMRSVSARSHGVEPYSRHMVADYCFTSKLVDGAYPDYDRVFCPRVATSR